jgi:hypothetical protein
LLAKISQPAACSAGVADIEHGSAHINESMTSDIATKPMASATTAMVSWSRIIWYQSSRLAVFGGLGMSFNICRGTLGSLAMFTAIRNASSRVRAAFGCGALSHRRGHWGAARLAHKQRGD